jgi:putative DNA methylase
MGIFELHIGWARRPLATCRAVLCAALWPDPAGPLCPQSFRYAAAKTLLAHAWQVKNEKGVAIAGVEISKWIALTQSGALDAGDARHQRIAVVPWMFNSHAAVAGDAFR